MAPQPLFEQVLEFADDRQRFRWRSATSARYPDYGTNVTRSALVVLLNLEHGLPAPSRYQTWK